MSLYADVHATLTVVLHAGIGAIFPLYLLFTELKTIGVVSEIPHP